ncbi:MAG: methyltransferase domain-containing protein [Thermomicrobiales bacterium]
MAEHSPHVDAVSARPCPSDALDSVLEQIRPGNQVLDAGCGAGGHLRRLAAAAGLHGQVTGLDADPDALALAATEVADLIAMDQVRLAEGALERIPFPADAFDLAWSAAVFHHLADVPGTLAELRRVLRPAGRLVIQDADLTGSFPVLPWAPELETPILDAALRAAAANHAGLNLGPFDPYIARKLPRLLNVAGFANVTVRAVVEVDQNPLSAAREAEICRWFLGPLATRLLPFMEPQDALRFQAAFTPSDPAYIFAEPTAFMARTSLVVSGDVSQ